MHVLHWISTRADNVDEAYNNVENQLTHMLGDTESFNGTWYDWFVVGGGRYNMVEDEDMLGAYVEGKTNMFISSKSVDEFNDRLATCIEFRIVEFDRYRDEWNNSGIDLNAKLDSYDGKSDYAHSLHPLGKMIDMLNGEWDYNSYFYDMENWSTNPEHMLKGIEAGEHWWLVPCDIHF